MTDLPWPEKAERVQRFVRVTGLRTPRGYARVCRRPTYLDGADHTLTWHDPEGRYIVSTEPYGTPYANTDGAARRPSLEEWCTAHGWDWIDVPACGNPPHTILYLLSPPKNGGDLERFKRLVARGVASGASTTVWRHTLAKLSADLR
jgi:hypothetical protein